MSDAAMPVSTTKVSRHASGRAFRAVGVSCRFRRRRGGVGAYAAGGRRQLYLFLPRALDHTHRLQELRRRARGPGEIHFHPHARQLRAGVQPCLFGRRTGPGHRLHALLLQFHLHCHRQYPARPHHRHAGRLWFLAVSAERATTPIFSSSCQRACCPRSWLSFRSS